MMGIDFEKLKPEDFEDKWCPVCGRGCLVRIGELGDEDAFIVCCGCGCVMEEPERCQELVKRRGWLKNDFLADMQDKGVLDDVHLYPLRGKLVIMNIVYHLHGGRLFVTLFYGRDAEGVGMADPMSVWRHLEGCTARV